MKLFRYRENNTTKPGIIIDEKMYDASSIVRDYNEAFFENDGIEKLKTSVHQNTSSLE